MPEHVVFVEMSLTGAGEKALEYCWQSGYEVSLITRMADRYRPLLAHPASLVECETNDFQQVVRAICELDARHQVDGVTTTHDLFVPQAALAAETLGLAGIPYSTATTIRNKYRQRMALAQHCPHLNPRFGLVHDVGEAVETALDFGLPVIGKPQNANNSWGVSRLDSLDAVRAYMEEAESWECNVAGQPLARGVLMESYIDGVECSVETVQCWGEEPQLIGVTGKEMAGAEYGKFVERGIFFPADYPHVSLLFQEVRTALIGLQVKCGVIHTECRIRDGAVKILEINPRIVGDMTGSHMIELAVGANPIDLVVETALGRKLRWQPTRQMAAGKFGICVPRSGLFGGIANLDELRSMDRVAYVRIFAQPGQMCYQPPRSNLDLVARLVALAPTPSEALQTAKDAASMAAVTMLPG